MIRHATMFRFALVIVLAATAALGLGALGGPTPAVALDDAPPDAADPTGTWEGKVLFANGWEGRVTLTLEAAVDGRHAGRYSFTLLDEEGPGRPRGGAVAVTATADGTITARLVDADGQLGATMMSGRLGAAGSHATAAIWGDFQMAKDRGVVIVWRYASR